MSWERVGIDRPVLDEYGKRPENDENGPRPREEVAYEPLRELEFEVNSLADISDRRWLEAVLDSLGMMKPLSIAYAADFDATLNQICRKFIRGIRLQEGAEYKGEDAARQLAGALDFNEAIVLLSWLRRKAHLESAKKKNWRQQFGLGT
jgi:hypothetical protein